MDNLRLRQLAGLITEGKKWSQEVTDKVKKENKPAEGTFTKKAGAIVDELLAKHKGNSGKAAKALSFYINRGGEDLENKGECEKALKKLEKMNESISELRKLAGLLVEKKSADDEGEDDGGEAGEGGGDEEDELPKIVTKIAKQAEGKDVEALEKLIMKVYDAGHKDGMKAAEEGEGGEEEEVKEGVESLEAKAKKQADKTNKNIGKDHDEDKKYDPAKPGKDEGPELSDVKKKMVSVHSTQSDAKAEAKRLNDEAAKSGKKDMRYDVCHAVHKC